jgi:hypothetical protein
MSNSNKVRCGDKIGINLDQVIAWKYFPQTGNDSSAILKLFIAGESFTIKQDDLEGSGFTDLHNRLIEEFDNDVVQVSLADVPRL